MATKKKKSLSAVQAKKISMKPLLLFLAGTALGLTAGWAWFLEDDVVPMPMAYPSYPYSIQIVTSQGVTVRSGNGPVMIEETVAGKYQPIMPFVAAEDAIYKGRIAAMANYCQIDWQEASASFFRYYNQQEGFNAKQMRFLEQVHDDAKSDFMSRLDFECSDENKAIIQRYLTH